MSPVGAGGVSVELRTLTALQHPVSLPVRAPGGVERRSVRRRLHPTGASGTSPALAVEVDAPGHAYRCRLPIRYQPGGEAIARRLLALVERASAAGFGSVAIRETLGSGTGAPEVTAYQVGMPDRFAYRLSRDGRPVSDTTIVGTHEWTRPAGQKRWQESVYGGGGPAVLRRRLPRMVDAVRGAAAAARSLSRGWGRAGGRRDGQPDRGSRHGLAADRDRRHPSPRAAHRDDHNGPLHDPDWGGSTPASQSSRRRRISSPVAAEVRPGGCGSGWSQRIFP